MVLGVNMEQLKTRQENISKNEGLILNFIFFLIVNKLVVTPNNSQVVVDT
jgi:hypothetical protein